MSRFNSFRTLAATALSVVSLLAASGAQATLSYRLNNQAVYDDVAKLTWLQDANANGAAMNWFTAMAWADGLSIGGVDDWRLPGGSMAYGYNQTASEMGNLFYNVLGGTANSSITTSNNATNYAFFQNVQNVQADYYWSGVAFASDYAWVFGFNIGRQDFGAKYSSLFAWAVRSGDVGGNPVPAPGTLALLGAGLLGWAGVKRSRHWAGAVIG
jgi:hypothetical protein